MAEAGMRLDSDGQAYPLGSFTQQYGEDEGRRRFQAAPQAPVPDSARSPYSHSPVGSQNQAGSPTRSIINSTRGGRPPVSMADINRGAAAPPKTNGLKTVLHVNEGNLPVGSKVVIVADGDSMSERGELVKGKVVGWDEGWRNVFVDVDGQGVLAIPNAPPPGTGTGSAPAARTAPAAAPPPADLPPAPAPSPKAAPQTEELRPDTDGIRYPLSSFLAHYGPVEGRRRWAAALQSKGSEEVLGQCVECGSPAAVYCHECPAAAGVFCSHACCVHMHRMHRLLGHTNITYRLSAARIALDTLLSPQQPAAPSPETAAYSPPPPPAPLSALGPPPRAAYSPQRIGEDQLATDQYMYAPPQPATASGGLYRCPWGCHQIDLDQSLARFRAQRCEHQQSGCGWAFQQP